MTHATQDRLSRREAHLIVRGRDIVTNGELRRVRETLGMSRPQLAALLGVNQFAIRAWEYYGSIPRAATLIRIAMVVGELRRAIDEERAATAG
jgi:DNA-binding transcriptional regulator YiaG